MSSPFIINHIINYLFHTAVAGAEANSQDSGVQGRDRVAGNFITCDGILLPEIIHIEPMESP